jgi:hypothetical protein
VPFGWHQSEPDWDSSINKHETFVKEIHIFNSSSVPYSKTLQKEMLAKLSKLSTTNRQILGNSNGSRVSRPSSNSCVNFLYAGCGKANGRSRTVPPQSQSRSADKGDGFCSSGTLVTPVEGSAVVEVSVGWYLDAKAMALA